MSYSMQRSYSTIMNVRKRTNNLFVNICSLKRWPSWYSCIVVTAVSQTQYNTHLITQIIISIFLNRILFYEYIYVVATRNTLFYLIFYLIFIVSSSTTSWGACSTSLFFYLHLYLTHSLVLCQPLLIFLSVYPPTHVT